jgi:hypothetical protein
MDNRSTMASDSAREKVLYLPELLEHILLCLPTKRIYGIRRVCKTWDTLLQTSPALKIHMFLAHDTKYGLTLMNPILSDIHTIFEYLPMGASMSDLPEPWSRPQASWQNMHVADQPIDENPLYLEFWDSFYHHIFLLQSDIGNQTVGRAMTVLRLQLPRSRIIFHRKNKISNRAYVKFHDGETGFIWGTNRC